MDTLRLPPERREKQLYQKFSSPMTMNRLVLRYESRIFFKNAQPFAILRTISLRFNGDSKTQITDVCNDSEERMSVAQHFTLSCSCSSRLSTALPRLHRGSN